MKTFADNWFMMYYGLMTKRTHISKRNLIQLQYSNHGNIIPEECYITDEVINTIGNMRSKK